MSRIAFIINCIKKNGPSNVVLNIINNLSNEQHVVYLITLFHGNSDDIVLKLRENGISVYECSKLSKLLCILGFQKELNRIIRELNIDVVHSHGLIPDLVVSRLNGNIKKISTIHCNIFEDYLDTYGYLKSKLYCYIHISALHRIHKCICCSQSVYCVMKKHVNNITYIRNGVEKTNSCNKITRKELGIPEDSRVFVFVGVINKRKNVLWLIEKFVNNHDNNEYLLVLGRGDKEIECRKKIDDHVLFLGFQNDPVAYMNISNVYISASRSEGFSISVLEALSCGLGLMLSDIPSHREVIEMEKETYIGEVFDELTFEEKWKKLRSCEFDKYRIKRFYEFNLSAKVMTAAYSKFYD